MRTKVNEVSRRDYFFMLCRVSWLFLFNLIRYILLSYIEVPMDWVSASAACSALASGGDMPGRSLSINYGWFIFFKCISKLWFKGTVSRALLGFWWHIWIDIDLKKRRAWFLIFFRYLSEFTEPFTYFFRLMRVFVGLIMLAAYFCQSCKSQVEYNFHW